MGLVPGPGIPPVGLVPVVGAVLPVPATEPVPAVLGAGPVVPGPNVPEAVPWAGALAGDVSAPAVVGAVLVGADPVIVPLWPGPGPAALLVIVEEPPDGGAIIGSVAEAAPVVELVRVLVGAGPAGPVAAYPPVRVPVVGAVMGSVAAPVVESVMIVPVGAGLVVRLAGAGPAVLAGVVPLTVPVAELDAIGPVLGHCSVGVAVTRVLPP